MVPSSPVAVQVRVREDIPAPDTAKLVTSAGAISSSSIALKDLYTFNRPLVTVFLVAFSGSTPNMSRSLTATALRPELTAQISAAAPATWGVAMEVPL